MQKINQNNVSDLKNWFTGYVKEFRYEDYESQQNIDLKLQHSQRVAEEITAIGKQMGLNDNELNLSKIIALFHDIGRFEQYDRYRTFSDHRSEDHAELGIKILKRQNILEIFDADIQNLIFCSIRYHNRRSLPTEETDDCLFYSRLLRDADKLDIWKVVTEYYHRKGARTNATLVLELPDTPAISHEVYDALMNRRIVDIKDVKSINDLKLLQAGLIYDLNFKPSFQFIKNRHYIESLRDSLPETIEITEIFYILKSYIEDHSA